MDNNNGFLSNYNKNMGDIESPAPEVAVRDADLGYKYEEKSGFKKPEFKGGGLPPFRRPKLLVPIIAGAVVVAGIILLLVLLLGGGAAVIDLTGKTLDKAQLWASQNGVMLTTNEQFNDEYEKGVVFAQDIAPGGTVKKGEFLTLTISGGHDYSVTLKVPDIMNMTADEIQAWAAANFMTKVRVTAEFSATVASGKVIRFTINDDTVISDEIRRDTPVYVIISKGIEDESAIQITVPDFKTMSVSEAYIFANDNGLILTVVEQYDDYVPKNSVISQSVKATEKVSKGSEIKLVVSKGKMVEIPDFSDYAKEQASAVAASLGISITMTEKYSSSSAGTFLSQSIPAGSVYEDGDILELTYSLGSITVPSFVGQTLDAIKSWENEVDKQGGRITISPSSTKSDKPKGTIIYQDKANTTVKAGSTIYVTLSSGKIVYVPDFVNPDTTSAGDTDRGYDTAVTREEAMKMCEDAGLIPVFVPGDKIKDEAKMAGRLPGEIWFQGKDSKTELPPYTEVAEGTKITLYYKPYETDDTYTLSASLTGLSKSDILANDDYRQHLNFVFVGDESGTVISQSVAAGTTVVMGTIVILTLG